ncbi:MAG: CHAT domain-containing protein, partial [Cyanobacteria bacterium J06560_2]
YLGSDVAHPDALDISRSDLQALGDLERLDIVPGDENRRLFISENIADGMNGELAVPVYIQGDRTTLVGPDFDNIWTLSAPSNGDGTSTLSGYSNLFFDNIQGLEGGELDDTVIFNSNSFEGPINGKSGDLTLLGDSFNLYSQISGTEKLSIQSISDEQEIWLGDSEGDLGGADTLDLGRFELANIADTFTSITIGDQGSGAIRLLDDTAFNSSLVLRSGETITTTGSTLSVDNGGTLTLEANTLSAGDLKTQGGDISLVGLFTSTQIDDESAEKADSPGIVAGRVQSQGGDISLVSPGRIEVISLDASGQRVLLDDDSLLEMPGGNISVETEGYFQATGYAPSVLNQSILFDSTAPDFPAEESTFESAHSVQTTEGALITIRHGGNAEVPFTVGEDSLNGSVGTLSNQASTISAGAYLGPYGVGDIQLITEAVPEVEPPVAEVPVTEVPVAEVPEVVTPIARLPAKPSAPSLPAVPILDERSGSRSSLDAVLVNSEAETSREAFSRIESAASTQFAQFLALSDRTQTQKVATLAEVQNTLKAAKLNLEITPALVYVYFVPSAASPASVAPDSEEINAFQQVGHSDDQLEVMLIPPSGDPIRRRQWGVTRAQVEEVAQALRFQATNAMSRKGDYLAPAQQLYQWMLGSLEPEFAQLGIDNLAFIMDDGLRTLPIAALHDGDRFLVEKYSLGLMPTFSLTDLESASSDRWRERSTSEVLAMGASRFSSQPPLPAVEAELEMISEELWSGEAFLNESFTLENLKTQLAQDRYSMLHLATHAVFNSGDWDNSYIQLWDEKVSLNQINELGLSEQEIELIILSACNTALGDLNSEYGFAGFAVNAGSEAALASLWPVSDEGTLGFMSQFYRQMAAGNLRSQSLRQAQISLLQGNVSIFNGELIGPDGTVLAVVPELAESGNWDFSHPFYWSAFTMIGNPW